MVKAEAGILESDAAERRRGEAPRGRRARVCAAPDVDWIGSAASTPDRHRRGHLGFRPARRGVRRLAPVRRRACRRAAERARLRRPALGGRRVARLHRRPRRLGDRCAAPRRRDRAAGAACAPRALGRRQAERDNVVARAALGVRDGRARARGARARRCSRPTCRRRCWPARAGTRSTPRSLRALSPSEARPQTATCRCPIRSRVSSPPGSTG